jgi:hypothetical protein
LLAVPLVTVVKSDFNSAAFGKSLQAAPAIAVFINDALVNNNTELNNNLLAFIISTKIVVSFKGGLPVAIIML